MQGAVIRGRSAREGGGKRRLGQTCFWQRTHWTTKRRPAARGRIGSQACSAQAMHALGMQAHDSCEGKPMVVPERTPRARALAAAGKRADSTCAAQTALLRQASEPSTPLKRRRACLFTKKSRFFILGVAKRRLADWILIVALSTMVCSDPTNSNASSRNSNSKSEALSRPATGCHPRTPRAGVWGV